MRLAAGARGTLYSILRRLPLHVAEPARRASSASDDGSAAGKLASVSHWSPETLVVQLAESYQTQLALNSGRA